MKKTKIFMLAVIALVASTFFILVLPTILIHDHFKLLLIISIKSILCLVFIVFIPQFPQTIYHTKLNKLRFATASFILLINLLVVIIVSTVSSPHESYILGVDPLALLTYWYYAQGRNRVECTSSDIQLQLQIAGVFPRKFDIKELKDATNNFEFPIELFIGTVFMGTLADGKGVMIKRVQYERRNSIRDSFLAEITAIAQIKHDNLVEFLGYCIALDFPYIVYEQVDAVRDWIFSEDVNRRRILTVDLRYHVALDVAKAITYIHSHRMIFHRFVKPCNLFLTRELKAKVGFSLSEALLTDDCSYHFRNSVAPEFLRSRDEASDKADVYLYGALLLKLVSGLRYFVSGSIDVYEIIKSMDGKIREGKLMECVEQCLEINEGDEEKLEVVMKVALLCVQEKPEKRPSMTEVISMLLGRHPLPSAEQMPLALTM